LAYEGALKIFVQDKASLTAYFGGLGFPIPEFTSSFISYFEFSIGIFIMAGIFVRFAAFFAAGEMAIATLVANLPGGITASTEVTVLLFAIFLSLSLVGGGRISVTRFLKRDSYSRFLPLVGLATIFLVFFISFSVFAAGGGGGGGGGGGVSAPPLCQEDTWTCVNWSECSIEGSQTRTCTLANDCPTTETPKPSESQSCTPLCTQDIWTCAGWGECSLAGEQTRTCSLTSSCSLVDTPKPIEKQTCQPECTADTWACTGFNSCQGGTQARTCTQTFDCSLVNTPKPTESQSCVEACVKDEYTCGSWSQCQYDGRQYRSCSLTKDCPGVSAARPGESRVCPGLSCGHLATLEDRIDCRLGLTQQELTKEFSVLYAPEYCKIEETKEDRNQCIRLYQEVGPCWDLPIGPSRTQCAKNVIGVGNIPQEAELCKSSNSVNACMEELKEKVEDLIIFRLYELEVQAEILMTDWGVPKEEIVAIEVFIETKKQEIEETEDIKEWKKIIQETKTRWQKFVNDIKPYIKNADK